MKVFMIILFLIPISCFAQKFIAHQSLSTEIRGILYDNEMYVLETLRNFNCDTIVFYNEDNTLIIMPKCNVSLYQITDTTVFGKYAAQHGLRSFSVSIPTKLITYLNIWRAPFTNGSGNQYLIKAVYKVMLKISKDYLMVIANSDDYYSDIIFKYKGKKYRTDCASQTTTIFNIGSVVNLDGSPNVNAKLCEMLKIPIK